MQTILGTNKQWNDVCEVFTGFWGSKVSIIFFFSPKWYWDNQVLQSKYRTWNCPAVLALAATAMLNHLQREALDPLSCWVHLGTPVVPTVMQVCQALNLLLLSESKIQFCLNDSLTQNLICTDNCTQVKYISFWTTGARWDNQFGLTMAEGVQEVFGKPIWKH